MSYYLYFAKSLKNNKVYVGYTEKDPDVRISEHNNGCNSWSRCNRPFALIYFEKFRCKQDVISREKFYKSGFGERIKSIIIKEISNLNKSGGSLGP
jgi:putative endonuclease